MCWRFNSAGFDWPRAFRFGLAGQLIFFIARPVFLWVYSGKESLIGDVVGYPFTMAFPFLLRSIAMICLITSPDTSDLLLPDIHFPVNLNESQLAYLVDRLGLVRHPSLKGLELEIWSHLLDVIFIDAHAVPAFSLPAEDRTAVFLCLPPILMLDRLLSFPAQSLPLRTNQPGVILRVSSS